MSSSEISSKCWHSPRMVLPWATIRTRFPLLMAGAISFSHSTRKRSFVNCNKQQQQQQHSGVSSEASWKGVHNCSHAGGRWM